MRYIAKDKENLYRKIDLAFTDKITPLKGYPRLLRKNND
jgi:hypothetical protein